MNRMVTAEAFREMVNQRVWARVGVSLDDLPDVDLEDWLEDDGIAADVAGAAADDAALAVLEENGWEADA